MSPAIALASAVIAYRSSRTARKSLDLAHKAAQAAYEDATADRLPAVSLFLTEAEYRRAAARDLDGILGSEARQWATGTDADSLEVVIRGRLVNNLPHEILLTCRDHFASGRIVWSMHRNQSVFIIGGAEVELGRTILPEEREVTFEWIDRRSKENWIDIYRLNQSSLLPRLTLFEVIRAFWRREPLDFARHNKVGISGF